MRIASQSGRCGLNDEGNKTNIRTIEYRVKKFRVWLTSRKDYPQNHDAQKMIAQIDKYWEKLFADPVTVQMEIHSRCLRISLPASTGSRYSRSDQQEI